MSDVEWRAVPGWEGLYDVSGDGRVRSLDRRVPHYCGGQRTVRGRLLRPVVRDGYPQVMLRRAGESRIFPVHQLVMFAFVGPRPEGMEVLHRDGDRSNPCVENLRWGTRTENVRDAVRHGTHVGMSRSRCPRGHRLEAPNLVRSNSALGWRMCRACHQVWSRVAKSDHLDMQVESDLRYRLIMSGEYDTARRDRCSRNHLLAEPNLVRSKLKHGRRACRACHQAGSQVAKGRAADMQQESDRRYALIMSGAPAGAARHSAREVSAQADAELSRDEDAPCSAPIGGA